MTTRRLLVILACLSFLLFIPAASVAQEKPEPVIDWQKGPLKADLSGLAQIQVPEGFLFTDRKGAQKLLELTQNIPSGKEVGAIVPQVDGDNSKIWFVIFEFNEIGFVKDDEKGKIDSDALLKSIQEGTEESNDMRKEKGWPAFHEVGWENQPFYDQRTNNLIWAIRGRDDKGSSSVNHSIRILGRHGTMNVDMVLGPEEYATALPAFNNLMGSFEFRQGSRYADFMKGDKVAEYGLTALIAGGAGALAVKTGFFMKMWKVILAVVLALKKLLIVIFVGLGAAIKKLWNKIMGRREEYPSAEPSTGDNLSIAPTESQTEPKPSEMEVGPKIE